MKAEDRAYCAGLYEGEGHLSTETGYNRKISLIIKMTDREPLDLFSDLVGYGKVYGPYESGKNIKGTQWKPHYILKITNYAQVQYTICNMWFWLSPRRKEQATQALVKYTSFKSADKLRRNAHKVMN